ncbi:glucosamine-6-phosphate deaminase [Singulisphaera sp. PoT]|uniref:glucosamine-6-phosphate deaminase n=1 Tax=Singulisphaera sp. PoT TaxID=3411797 RepID=UPI003BF59B8F
MPAPARVLSLAGATVQVFADAPTGCRAAADQIAQVTRSALEARGRAVLGLATGSTPIPIYARLIELVKSGELSFADVITYNLDEYYPISPLDPNSYRYFMHKYLFSQVDLPSNRAHVLDGSIPEAFAAEQAAAYDRWIVADGGLDLQLLGLGRNGHIGFNEPSDLPLEEALALPTRLTDLDPITIADAAKDFGGEANVIRRALTVGVAPILAAGTIVVAAFGGNKAEAVAQSLKGPKTPKVPGSLLQTVPGKVTWYLDEASAKGL